MTKRLKTDPENRYQASIDMFRDLQCLAEESDLHGSLDPSPLTSTHANVSQHRSGTFAEISHDDGRGAAHVSFEDSSGGVEWAGDSNGGVRVGELAHVESHPSQARNSARSGGTEVVDERLVTAAVETDMAGGEPYSASEPLVPNYVNRSRADHAGEFRATRASRRGRRDVEQDSNWGEILALVFAAAVGIGCGFMFLKLFAPSLLAKWHF